MKVVELVTYSTISVDGGLDYSGGKVVLSSNRDLYRLHSLRASSDAVMVGAGTVAKDDPMLTVRLPGYCGRQPLRVVVDGKLFLRPTYRVFDTSIAPSAVVTSVRSCESPAAEAFRSRGVDLVCVEEVSDGELDLREALEQLSEKRGVRRVLVEGGGYLIGTLLKQRLVSKLIVSISPALIGTGRVGYVNTSLGGLLKLRVLSVSFDHDTGEIIVVYEPIYK